MEPGGGALLKRSIICGSPRAPCILVRGRERRKKNNFHVPRSWSSFDVGRLVELLLKSVVELLEELYQREPKPGAPIVERKMGK